MKNIWYFVWYSHPNRLLLVHTNQQTENEMKNFTAIYDTKTIKGIQYSFKSDNIESAKIFSDWKFDHANISNFKIIED